MFADKVNISCDSNKEQVALKRKMLDNVGDYTKGKSRHSEIWWWDMDVDLTLRNLGFGSTVKKRKTEQNTVSQRNMLIELFQWLWIWKFRNWWERLFPVVMVTSYLELQNKRQKNECQNGRVKVYVNDRKQTWKKHMKIQVNVRNKWGDTTLPEKWMPSKRGDVRSYLSLMFKQIFCYSVMEMLYTDDLVRRKFRWGREKVKNGIGY